MSTFTKCASIARGSRYLESGDTDVSCVVSFGVRRAAEPWEIKHARQHATTDEKLGCAETRDDTCVSIDASTSEGRTRNTDAHPLPENQDCTAPMIVRDDADVPVRAPKADYDLTPTENMEPVGPSSAEQLRPSP